MLVSIPRVTTCPWVSGATTQGVCQYTKHFFIELLCTTKSLNKLSFPSYRDFPYLRIYPKEEHAPKPQIRMIVHAPKLQIRMLVRVPTENSIIHNIYGPQLKTRRNRNFPHNQRSFPRTFRCVSSKSQLRKARSVCGSAMRFGGSCQVGNPGIQMIVHALKCGIRLFDRALICGWYPN